MSIIRGHQVGARVTDEAWEDLQWLKDALQMNSTRVIQAALKIMRGSPEVAKIAEAMKEAGITR